MNISDELQRLQELHQNGTLTDEEFATAKSIVLKTAQASYEPSMETSLQELRMQNEVMRLEKDWEIERQRYMVSGKYGHRFVPSQMMSILTGIAFVAFGIFWISFASTGNGPSFVPLLGIVIIVIGVGMSINMYMKATAHDKAFQQYQCRREQLLNEPGEQPQDV